MQEGSALFHDCIAYIKYIHFWILPPCLLSVLLSVISVKVLLYLPHLVCLDSFLLVEEPFYIFNKPVAFPSFCFYECLLEIARPFKQLIFLVLSTYRENCIQGTKGALWNILQQTKVFSFFFSSCQWLTCGKFIKWIRIDSLWI